MEKLTREQVLGLMESEDEFFVLKFMTYASSLDMIDEDLMDILLDIIIKKGNGMLLCEIAAMVDGVDIEKIEDALISIGNVASLHNFVENIDGANISKIKEAIVNINNSKRRRK